MEDVVRTDILKLFQANPMLRDSADVLATRVGRRLADVEKALEALEAEGIVARRWTGQTAHYYFTGSCFSPNLARASGDTSAKVPPQLGQPSLPNDDITLSARIRVPSTTDGIRAGRVTVEGMLRAAGMPAARIAEMIIAVSEALTNAYRYGRRGDQRDFIRIDVRGTAKHVQVRVADRGSGFPFLLVGTSHGDNKSTGGRGLMLIKSFTDSLKICRTPGGTIVEITKNLKEEMESKNAVDPDKSV